ncbi:mannitol dehydrogenase family protein [Algibacillus agarilyticus]|uniref:mannitol dehydrogenase family protein n=1 Tax=Algibacillus agarilyticus TaxID=2234133 RepID=UPI000DD07578|nr:mannitol dehydrogenase family protein [Algibacillus agarilyticus]
MKLNNFNLAKLAEQQGDDSGLTLPKYDRSQTGIGIVHLGLGAFHRSHQAYYTEKALNEFGGDWAICGVSMRSTHTRDAMASQDNLFTIAKLDQQNEFQVVGAIKEVLVAAEQLDQVLERMTAATTKIVSLTVTEKGYCLDSAGNLDLALAGIKHDLLNQAIPSTAIGLISKALQTRKENGIAPFQVLACDNLPANGKKLKAAIVQYSRFISSELSDWISEQVNFPNTMVDSITPKTEQETIDLITNSTGLVDSAPVQRESFTQWVIEDCLHADIPHWDKVGVTYSNDVAGYEHTKLRILNGLHSALAYLGRVAGYDTVYQAINDSIIKKYLLRLVDEEIIPSIAAPAGLDLHVYSRDIIKRFENVKIQHHLEQIACDGSIKIAVRTLEPITENLQAARSIQLLSIVVAAWIQFVYLKAQQQQTLNDPNATQLIAIVSRFNNNAMNDIECFLAEEGIIPETLRSNVHFKQALTCAYQKIIDAGDSLQSALI